jgi:hypothetical protein
MAATKGGPVTRILSPDFTRVRCAGQAGTST